MLFHKFDPATNLYIESVEAEIAPANSVSGRLPDMTDEYTCALINGEIVSVARPVSEAPEITEEERFAEQARIAEEQKKSTFTFKGTTIAALRTELNEWLALNR